MGRRIKYVKNAKKRDKKTGKFMSENRPKTHVISFRIEDEIYQSWKLFAGKSSVGAWIKWQIFNGEVLFQDDINYIDDWK